MTITNQHKWNKCGVVVNVYGGVNEDATAATDYDDGDHVRYDCDYLRDGYKPVVEVEEKHGGFTVYSER